MSKRNHSPFVGAIVAFVVAAAFAARGDIGMVAAVTNFSVYCTFLSVNLSVIALRFRQPDATRPFSSPLSIARVPVLPILGLVAVVSLVGFLKPSALVLGFGALVVGAAVFSTLHLLDPASNRRETESTG